MHPLCSLNNYCSITTIAQIGKFILVDLFEDGSMGIHEKVLNDKIFELRLLAQFFTRSKFFFIHDKFTSDLHAGFLV